MTFTVHYPVYKYRGQCEGERKGLKKRLHKVL